MRLVVLLQLGARAVVLQQIARVEQKVHEIELAGEALALLVEADDFPELVAQVRGEVRVGVQAELFDGGVQFLPGGGDGFPSDTVAVFAVALFQPAHVTRQTQQFVLKDVAVEAAGGAGALNALQEFGERTQAVVKHVLPARAAIAQREHGFGFLDDGFEAGVAVEAALVPGRVEVAPLGERPGGFAEFIEGLGAIALLAPGEACERADERGRRGREALLDPALEDAGEDAQGVGLGQFLEYRIDAGFHGAAAQQLRAEGVDGADEGAVERAGGVGQQALADFGVELGGAALLEFVADAELHVAGGGVGESDGDDGFDMVPAAMASTMRDTRAVVLPVPAEASTTQLLSSAGAGVSGMGLLIGIHRRGAETRRGRR